MDDEVHSGLTVAGILENLKPTNADQWCSEVLKEFEDASSELEALRADPKVMAHTSLVGTAKLIRAEKRLDAATTKADAASLVLQLKESTNRGDIAFDLPEINLNIRITWQ